MTWQWILLIVGLLLIAGALVAIALLLRPPPPLPGEDEGEDLTGDQLKLAIQILTGKGNPHAQALAEEIERGRQHRDGQH
jgi:hypothetical protein